MCCIGYTNRGRVRALATRDAHKRQYPLYSTFVMQYLIIPFSFYIHHRLLDQELQAGPSPPINSEFLIGDKFDWSKLIIYARKFGGPLQPTSTTRLDVFIPFYSYSCANI